MANTNSNLYCLIKAGAAMLRMRQEPDLGASASKVIKKVSEL